MAVQTITYSDKSYINQNASVAATNKVQDSDMNEIKSVVNNNATELSTFETNIADNQTYSTNEVDTGKKWIDNKTIYRKVINFGTLPNATAKSVAHSISNLDTMVSMSGVGYSTTGSRFPIPYVHSSSITDQVQLYANTTEITIVDGIDRTNNSAYIILEYTKSS